MLPPRIIAHLHLAKTTIHKWLGRNSGTGLGRNLTVSERRIVEYLKLAPATIKIKHYGVCNRTKTKNRPFLSLIELLSLYPSIIAFL